MAKYYLCEGNNPNSGIDKVTPFHNAEDTLNAANQSKAKVHFISTVNPLEDSNTNG